MNRVNYIILIVCITNIILLLSVFLYSNIIAFVTLLFILSGLEKYLDLKYYDLSDKDKNKKGISCTFF